MLKLKLKARYLAQGFTIVELLVVIVVIAILAALTMLAYNGISNQANISVLSADLSSAAKVLRADNIQNGSFPDTLAAANGGRGITPSSGVTFDYFPNSTGYCITATKGSTTYKIVEDAKPVQGDCSNYGLVLNLDAGDIASYPGSGTTWTDLSGVGNNGTLANGTAYSADGGGSMNFDGVDDYIDLGSPSSLRIKSGDLSVDFWFKVPTGLTNYRGIFCPTSNSGTWHIYTFTDSYYFRMANAEGANAFDFSSYRVSIDNNTWVHAVFTAHRNKSNGSMAVRSYKNGVLVGTNTINAWGSFDTVRNYRIWTHPTMAAGKIGTVKIYNRPLTATEVSQSFNSQRARYGL